MLHLPQRVGDARAIRQQRRNEPRQQTQQERNSHPQRGNFRRESEVREASQHVTQERHISEPRDDATGNQNSQQASHKSEQQCLAENQPHNQSAGESERLQNGDFLLTFTYCDAHRVGRHQKDGEGHRHADTIEQQCQVSCQRDEACAKRLFGLRLGLVIAVFKSLVDFLRHRARVRWIIDLRRKRAYAYLSSRRFVEVLEFEVHRTQISAGILGLVRIVDTVNDKIERLAYAIRRNEAFQLKGVADLPSKPLSQLAPDNGATHVTKPSFLLVFGQHNFWVNA